MELTQDRLKQLLYYDPLAGVFTWLVDKGRAKKGMSAGYINTESGYIIVAINNRNYRAHRLAFLYIYGALPPNQVDHINGVRHDNRFSNLRYATASDNMCNRGAQVNNKVGLKGVTIDHSRRYKKYQATIRLNRKSINLGRYYTAEEAYRAYCKAADVLHREYANHGK